MQSHPSLFLRGCLASIALHSLMHIANAASIPLGLQTSSGFYSTPRPQSSNSQNINLGISDTRLLFGELLHTTFKSDVAIIDDWLYMSWADAARIEYVVVETNPEVFPPDHHVHPKQEQLTTMKIGDENPIEIFLEQDLFVRLLAVDKWGRILGSTEAVKLPEGMTTISVGLGDAKSDARHLLILGLAMMCFGIIFAWLADEFGRRKQETDNTYTAIDAV